MTELPDGQVMSILNEFARASADIYLLEDTNRISKAEASARHEAIDAKFQRLLWSLPEAPPPHKGV